MKKIITLITILFSFSLFAKPSVLTTIPDFAWMLKEIGKEHVKVESLLSGHEDPHFVSAMPSFIFKVSKADLLCMVGLELEIGWLPKIIEKSANSKLRLCDTGKVISPLDVVHHHIDRSMGDVHAAGNPHYSLSPKRMLEIVSYYTDELSSIAPDKKRDFEKNAQELKAKLQELDKLLKQELKPFSHISILEYHKEFTYFIHDYGLQSKGAVESIPGVPPSSGDIVKVMKRIKEDKVKLILATPLSNRGILDKLEDITEVRSLILPVLLRTDENNFDYILHMREILEKIKAQLKTLS